MKLKISHPPQVKRGLLISCGLAVMLFCSHFAQAASEPAAKRVSTESSQAGQASTPDGLIRTVAQTLIVRIKQGQKDLRENPEKLYAMVDEVVLPHFDFPLMGRLVLGSQWTQASTEQQVRFLNGFKTLMVKTYGNALLQYSNESITFSPAEEGSKPDRASVGSKIQSPGSDPVSMEYKMRKLDDHWLVYDVVVDNISLVTNYRGTYASEIQRSGLDSLISKLEKQIAG
jgi:phospholipid transport system substrate-binding protein